MLKSNLETGPMHVWTVPSIEGHVILCFLSLTLQRTLEYLLKEEGVNLSATQIQDSLRSGRVSLIEFKGISYYIKNTSDENFKKILDALKLKDIPVAGKEKQIKVCRYTK